MGSSPLGAPSGNPGQQANAMSQVRQAIDMLQKALPSLPVGSDPHKSVLSAIQSISKVVPPTSEIPGVQQAGLRDMQQQAQQSGMMQALMRAMGQSAGSPAGGGAPIPGAAPPGVGAAAE
jgi:hypothetical protein